ncbi:retrovirus-related pol polyprotein from transposon TNT 1-94 [Tanacetum coccineum]
MRKRTWSQLLAQYFKTACTKPTNKNLRTSSTSRRTRTEATTPRYNNASVKKLEIRCDSDTYAGDRGKQYGSPVVQRLGYSALTARDLGHYARECRKPKRGLMKQALEAHYITWQDLGGLTFGIKFNCRIGTVLENGKDVGKVLDCTSDQKMSFEKYTALNDHIIVNQNTMIELDPKESGLLGHNSKVTQQSLLQRNQAVRNTNVLKPGMFRIASTTTQTRTPQLPHASRNTNPHMSKSSGVIHTTSVSRPQLKCYQVKDKVVPNNSQVKFQKKEVEDHHRISSISKKTKSVTACNDSSNSRTSNENAVCAECGTCVFNSNHDACVSRYLKDVNARTKKPNVVPISASKPKRKANKSVATPHKKTVASDTTIQKSKSYYKELYENTNQEWKWWIAKRCPSGYTWTQKPLRTKKIWMPKIRKDDESTSISPTIDIVSRITNVLKISNSLGSNLSNVPSSSNSLADCTTHPIHFCSYSWLWRSDSRKCDDQTGLLRRRLNHNIFSVGQFCDADMEVAFRKSTCFVRDLQGNDLLIGNRGSNLYIISLQETTSTTPICFMAKALPTQAWLWHRRLSQLNFDYITFLSKKEVVNGLPKLKYVKDQLCSSCEMSKAKRSSFKTKAVLSSKGRLNLLHMDLYGPMRVASINGKKYILVIVDDYSRYTWTLFLRSKDETPETLHAYFKEEGIEHQTSTPRTPEQNGVVERRNRTLVEAARTMLSASKLPLSFWAEAVATACYTQNRSIIISTHGKTAYHIINDRKPSIKHLHIFGCICYITRDGENLDKMKEKGDPCVMVGYSTQSKGYRVYNKRTRLIKGFMVRSLYPTTS